MRRWPLFRNRDYMLFWSGQALSELGSQTSTVAYPSAWRDGCRLSGGQQADHGGHPIEQQRSSATGRTGPRARE
jgi:hypothetical protein